MEHLANKYVIHIQLGVAILFLVISGQFIARAGVYADTVDKTVARVTQLEADGKNLVTKDDLERAVKNLEAYINKH